MIPMKTLTMPNGKTYEIVDERARNAINTEREDIRRSCSTAIVNTVEGCPIQIDDASDNQLLGLRVFGNTTQFTTTGKNKVDMSSFEFNDSNYTHIIPNDDPAVVELWNLLKTNVGKSIVVSMTTTGTVSGIAIGTIRYYDSDNNAICILVPGVEHVIQEVPESYAVVYIYGSSTGASAKNIQVEFGSAATTYEPYTGGIPAPNPDYPQELVSVGDSGMVKIRSSGKNLFPINDVEFVRDLVVPLDIDYHADSYVFSAVITSTDIDDDACAVMFYKDDEWVDSVYMPRTTAGERVSYKKYVKKDFNKIRFYAARSYGKSEGDTCNMFDIQLEIGEVATEAEPYKVSNATVPTPNGLPGIPVTTEGNYTDSNGKQWVCDEIDFERGLYIKRIKTKVVDGTVNPTTFAEGLNGGTVFGWSYDAFGMADIARDRSPKLCDKLSHPDDPTPGSYKACRIGQYGFNTDGSADSFLLINVGTFETADDVATWLQSHPITFKYVLATSVEYTLTEEQIAEYKKLYTNHLNTVIVNDYNAQMEAKYNVDLQSYINRQINKALENIVSGNIPNAEGVSF